MSEKVEEQSDDIMADSLQQDQDAVSDLGDRSSSLSDIEDKEGEPEEHDEHDDEHDDIDELESGNESPDENDSEAETERLEDSPHSQRKLKDVVITSHSENQTFSKSPSKLKQQFVADADEDEDEEHDVDELSEEEASVDGSPKSPEIENAEQDLATASTPLEDSSGESKIATNILEQNSKKRKRSLLADHDPVEGTDVEEPARKRTGSIGVNAEEYTTGDAGSVIDEGDASNPISGDVSDIDSVDAHGEDEDPVEPNEDDGALDDDALDSADISKASTTKAEGKKTRKQHETSVNGLDTTHENEAPDHEKNSGANPAIVEDDEAEEGEEAEEAEAEDAEAAIRNEEEHTERRKRFAMDQLGDIEQHFTSFRDRLHEERLALLDREEWMLRQDPPTHPQYLAMLQCIDARRDEKLRIEQRLIELRRETLQRSAVAKRSQIFAQFYQDVRDIREKTLELLGKQWYEIQHDRRGYGVNVEDYAIKFPTRRSQQLKDQYAYNTEVSILSGIAKYVGFPAAPPMASATSTERDQDLEKMGKSQHKLSNRAQPSLPLQDLAALRAATTTSTFNPAEEQFIESTPWANPQHPSHVHLLQRQVSNHQSAGSASPLPTQKVSQTSKVSQQDGSNPPVSGTFTSHNLSHATNGGGPSGGRVSPLNPFASSNVSQNQVSSSPLNDLQASLSPEQNRQPLGFASSLQSGDDRHQPRTEGHASGNSSTARNLSQGFAYDSTVPVKREQPLASGGRY